MAMDEHDREHRVERRTGRRIAAGAIVGAIVGAALGLGVGAIIFDPWTAAHWTMALAGAILGGGIAFVQAGMSGLESVNPGNEPYEREDPLREDDSWTTTERDERSA